MKIALNKIKPSPNPIRTSWDEEKMEELARSIKEQGLIVPVKVRPDNGEYELVYGHRRTEAARRAGETEFEAIVEGLDDFDSLIQQITENESKEDVPYGQKAQGYERALNHPVNPEPGNRRALARRIGISHATINTAIRWIESTEKMSGLRSPDTQKSSSPSDPPTSVRNLEQIQRAVGDDWNLQARLAKKAGAEGLNREQTRQVAESVAAAEDEAEQEAILTTEYHDPAFHQLVRVKASVKRRQQRREKKERQENPREVKEYIEAVQTFSGAVQLAIKVAEFGKFSPEAGRFLVGWHDSIRQGLDKLEQIWKEHDSA